MNIQSAQFDVNGYINAVIDGVTFTIPDDMSNRYRQAIEEWTKLDNANKILTYITPSPTTNEVNTERDRRIRLGATFNGIYVTGSDDDARNITNLALAAQLNIAANNTTTITIFRDGNNIDHQLTPIQVLGLWQQSATYVSTLYAKSWAIKAMNPIPFNFKNDSYWT